MVAELRHLILGDGRRRQMLIRCGVEGVITSAANGVFDKFGVGVGYSSVIAVAREDSDAIETGCGNLMMWLLDGAATFSSAFHMIRS